MPSPGRERNGLVSTADFVGTDSEMLRVRRPTIGEELLSCRVGVSLGYLIQRTGLSREGVLEQIKDLRKEYGVTGNERKGWSLNGDPSKVAAMRQKFEKPLKRLTEDV